MEASPTALPIGPISMIPESRSKLYSTEAVPDKANGNNVKDRFRMVTIVKKDA